ncbi:AGC family protein kinase [Histomonas meleagridis]|uniref:AGC family protein kinase n=1 Tax=Histomonas meleagridis TaxID=135588 RepID=UPI003559EF88|nr:AGC family protein kinase [Histomonas meleagridis]KAH0802634.1 AGC family protein kinase [Histomonas meleagridis]
MIKNQYKLGKILGEGAYGHVILGEHVDDGQEVAIKIINKKKLIYAKKTKSPENEKEALLRTSHPCLVSFLDSYQDNLCIYFVFELLPNGSLKEFLDSKPSVLAIRHVFSQLLMGISHIHQNGIIHRDLKPENIYFDKNYMPKIIDFGSCKLFDRDDTQKNGFTRGSFVGSVDYISPEVLSGDIVTPSADLWAFGCMLYLAFTGNAPFYAETKMQTYQNIEKCHYEIDNKIPNDATDLIERLLVLDAANRIGFNEEGTNYQTIRSHAFFNGINWENVLITPYTKNLIQ